MWALPAALLDGVRMVWYGVAVTGRVAVAVGTGCVAVTAGLLGAAVVDSRCRARFRSREQQACCH